MLLFKGTSKISEFVKKRRDPFGVTRAKLYSVTSVNARLANLCELALMAGKFTSHGQLRDERTIISFLSDGITYVAIIRKQTMQDVLDGLIVEAVNRVGSGGLKAEVEAAREAYDVAFPQ